MKQVQILIRQGLPQPERLATLNGTGIYQMGALLQCQLTSGEKKSLKKPSVLKADQKS